jgi:uncharacterized protein (DUF2141 family)
VAAHQVIPIDIVDNGCSVAKRLNDARETRGRWMQLLAIGFVVVLGMLAASAARSSELRVTITGVRSESGELLIGLYETEKGFEGAIANAETSGIMADRNRLVGVAMRARPGSQQAVFAQLPPGRYAVIVVHDENDDGRLDANALGVPTEGYGFSKDARGFLSAPSFDAAAITIGDADMTISLSLIYPSETSSDDDMEYYQFFSGSPPPK